MLERDRKIDLHARLIEYLRYFNLMHFHRVCNEKFSKDVDLCTHVHMQKSLQHFGVNV